MKSNQTSPEALASRILNILDPYEVSGLTTEDIKRDIAENPQGVIDYLVSIIERTEENA